MTSDEKKLSRDEWERLNDQFQRTPDPDEGSSASGEHYMLNFILNRLGYHPMSRREAIKIAERLLSNGWTEDN
ncbi:MAG: hypothetical protein RBS45_06435 [Anaerolineales bacterium]|jgi:hypothetical protein|nr:hypothetical protein [Anaerolineales bacterium]GER81133.1 conserved hypothetical protein [Candidatus Denitrolinea symbiosum]